LGRHLQAADRHKRYRAGPNLPTSSGTPVWPPFGEVARLIDPARPPVSHRSMPPRRGEGMNRTARQGACPQRPPISAGPRHTPDRPPPTPPRRPSKLLPCRLQASLPQMTPPASRTSRPLRGRPPADPWPPRRYL